MAINQSALADGMREVRYRISRAFPGVQFTLDVRDWGRSVLVRLGGLFEEVECRVDERHVEAAQKILAACGRLVRKARAQELATSGLTRRRAFRAKQQAMRARRLVADGIRRRLSRMGQVTV